MKKMSEQDKIGYVLIHGAGLRSDVWEEVAYRLDAPCLNVEFPGRSGDRETRGLSFQDYADHIVQQVSAWNIPRFVVVAHSIGGLLGLRLCAELPDRASGFAAVSAAIPKGGEGSFVSVLPFPQKQIMSLVLRTIGTRPPESQLRNGLCNDLTPEQSDVIVRRFVPESVRLYTDCAATSIPSIPKMYVQCTNDRELDVPLQKKMAEHLSAHYIHALNTGHLPMVSDPTGLSGFLKQFVIDARLQTDPKGRREGRYGAGGAVKVDGHIPAVDR